MIRVIDTMIQVISKMYVQRSEEMVSTAMAMLFEIGTMRAMVGEGLQCGAARCKKVVESASSGDKKSEGEMTDEGEELP